MAFGCINGNPENQAVFIAFVWRVLGSACVKPIALPELISLIPNGFLIQARMDHLCAGVDACHEDCYKLESF